MRATRFNGILLMMVIGISGLGIGTSSEAAPSPCSLITTTEVEQIIGKLAGTPRADQEGSAAWCNYAFANGKDDMSVWVFPADGIERGRTKSKNPQAVQGLGEEAFFDRGMHGLDYVNLFIKKGKTTIQLSLKETGEDEKKIKTLAKKAVDRF